MTGPLTVLTYHAIDDSGSVLATDPAWFVESMDRLAASNWRCVDLASWIAEGRPSVDRGFAIAFDDGLASLLAGVEALERLGFGATIFLVSGRIGRENDWPGQPKSIPKARLLDASEIVDLRSRGFDFGAHSRDHPNLIGLDDAALDREILGSKADIEDLTGGDCRVFAYPYGASSGRVRNVVRRYFSAGFGTRPGPAGRLDPIDDLPRLDAYDLRTPQRLDALISGRLASALRLRWAARRVRLAARSLG